jgi:hypothetical protein
MGTSDGESDPGGSGPADDSGGEPDLGQDPTASSGETPEDTSPSGDEGEALGPPDASTSALSAAIDGSIVAAVESGLDLGSPVGDASGSTESSSVENGWLAAPPKIDPYTRVLATMGGFGAYTRVDTEPYTNVAVSDAEINSFTGTPPSVPFAADGAGSTPNVTPSPAAAPVERDKPRIGLTPAEQADAQAYLEALLAAYPINQQAAQSPLPTPAPPSGPSPAPAAPPPLAPPDKPVIGLTPFEQAIENLRDIQDQLRGVFPSPINQPGAPSPLPTPAPPSGPSPAPAAPPPLAPPDTPVIGLTPFEQAIENLRDIQDQLRGVFPSPINQPGAPSPRPTPAPPSAPRPAPAAPPPLAPRPVPETTGLIFDQLNAENARAIAALQAGTGQVPTVDVTQLLENIGPVLNQQERSRAVDAGKRVAQLEKDARDAEDAQIAKELPGTLGSVTPIYGSVQSSRVHVSHGNYVRGVAYGALAISDVFLVKSVALGVGKLALKAGGLALGAGAGVLAKSAAEEALETFGRSGAKQLTLHTGPESRVYQLVDEAGEPWRFGETVDIRTRLSAHGRSFGRNFRGLQLISDPLALPQARALEESLGETLGEATLSRESGSMYKLGGGWSAEFEGLSGAEALRRPSFTLLNPGYYPWVGGLPW